MKIGQNEQTLAYADDVQLYLRETRRETTERTAMQQHVEGCPCMINCRAEGLLRSIPAHFAEYNMKVNPEKITDDVIATRICCTIETLRIVLGSEIAGERELAQRKIKSEAAYNAKLNIWKHRHLSETTKMKIFKTTVQCFYTQSGAAEKTRKRPHIREAY